MRTHRKPDRRARPLAEGLEQRQLLDAKTRLINGTPINDKDLNRLITQLSNTYSNGERIPASDRRFTYQTPQGRTAIVTLYGKGTLKGSTVNNGVLDLVFNKTTSDSRILGQVVGGGQAPLSGIRDADSTPGSPSSSGVDPISAVKLHSFALVDGGHINLTGGVDQLDLYSLGRSSEVHLREMPQQTSTGPSSEADALNAALIGLSSGFTGAGSGLIGVNTGLIGSAGSAAANTPPPGIEFSVVRVDAGPLPSPPLENAQVYAVDPAGQKLIRFDGGSGNPTLAINLPTLDTADPAVGLAPAGGHKAVLVGDSQTIYAYDSVSGTPLGAFTTTNLAGAGFHGVDGIGGSDTRTLLVDANGPAVLVNLAASLATGHAVPTSPPFNPARELTLLGGATALAGSNVLYATAAAHFDSFQPNRLQLGVIALTPTPLGLVETSRTAFPGPIDAGSAGGPLSDPSAGFGSVDATLARITGYADGKNTVTLYTPTTLATAGSITLNYPAPLHGLSESFYPDLRNAALVDVQGNLKRFSATSAQGLVINGRSLVNLVAINHATDTAIVGQPISHIAIPHRQNVVLISTARGVDGKVQRNGVTVEKSIPTLGVVSLP